MTRISQRPDLSVVRIYGQQGVVGAGFLVSPEYVLTCAHVVATALGINSDSFQRPTQAIELDFPTIEANRRLRAEVEFWLPVRPGTSPEDIAALKLIGPPPEKAIPASLVAIEEDSLNQHPFEALGFPERRSGGAWADGVIRRPVAYGWIQLGDTKETGYRLEEGFSGTPIWDMSLRGVVGMAVAADKLRPEVKAAFFIPTNTLLEVDELSEICRVERRTQELINLLQPHFEDLNEEMGRAYQQCLPRLSINLSRELPQSLFQLVTNLDNRRENNYSLLEQFVGHLIFNFRDENASSELSQDLEQWLNQYQANPQTLMSFLEAKRAAEREQEVERGTREPCLLFGIFERNAALNVKAWLIKDVRRYSATKGTDCELLTKEELTTDSQLQNLPELLNSLCQQSLNYCQCNIKKVQVFLPYKLMGRDLAPIDSLVIDEGNPYAPPIGTECEVNVRFSERLKAKDKLDKYSAKWQEKSQKIQTKINQSVTDIFRPLCSSNPAKLFKQLMPDNVVATRLTDVPNKSKLESTMEVFYYAGIPLALWIRKEVSGINHEEELGDMCQGCRLDNLSETVKNKRHEAWGEDYHIGNHLSLLWDDSELVPPANLLSMS